MHSISLSAASDWWTTPPERWSTTWHSAWPWGFAIAGLLVAIVLLVVLVRVGIRAWVPVVPAAVIVVLVSVIGRHIPSDGGVLALYAATIVAGLVLLVAETREGGIVLAGGGAAYGIWEALNRVAANIPAPVPLVILIIVVAVVWARR